MFDIGFNYGVTSDFKTNSYSLLGNKVTFCILIFGVLIIFLKNSNEKLLKNKINFMTRSEKIFYITISILFLNRVSTFLYFNF